FVGKPIADFHVDPAELEDVLKRLIEGETVTDREVRLRHKHGHICYGLVNTSGFWQDGKFIHTRCFTRDVTELKTAAIKLQESEERFRLALSSGAVTVYEQDRDLRYNWVYPTVPYRDDVIGKTDLELDPGRGGEERTELKRKVIDTGESIRQEIRATVKNVDRSYDLLVEPRLSPEGEVIGVVGTALDITEQQKAANELAETVRRQSALYHLSDRLNRA